MGEKMEKIFDGKKKLKLGTEKNPAIVNVKTKKRMKGRNLQKPKRKLDATIPARVEAGKSIKNAAANKAILKKAFL